MSQPAKEDSERPADYAAWRRSVEKALGEVAFEEALTFKTRDGLDVEPLYAAESVAGLDLPPAPGTPPYTRGTRRLDASWRIGQEIACPPTDEATEAMRVEQRRGVGLLWMRFAGAGAIVVEELVAAVEPGTEVVLEIGVDARSLAAGWLAASRERGLRPAGGIGCDPLTRAVATGRSGSLEEALRELTELATWTAAEMPGMRSVLVSGTRLHDRGATSAQELALVIAAGVEYLRRLTAAGLGVDAAAGRMDFAFSIGRDFFGEIAKLRAARLLWSKVIGASGGGEAAQAMRLHARTSRVETSRLDPWINLLRGGAQSFAAAAGGADSIVCAPHDQVLGSPGEVGRRLAVGVQHVLSDEAHLGRVVDPAGGSWYLESLTDALARDAWRRFQDLERRGGMARCVADGVVAEQLTTAAEDRRRAVAEGREPVIGASVFVDPAEASARQPPAAGGEPASRPGLAPFRLAEPFEHGRLKGEGSRPSRGEPA